MVSFIFLNLVEDETALPFKHKKKICIVGAGPSGLGSARLALKYKDEFDIIIFERNSDIGGQWLYSDDGYLDEHNLPVHSSVYKYLMYTYIIIFHNLVLSL